MIQFDLCVFCRDPTREAWKCVCCGLLACNKCTTMKNEEECVHVPYIQARNTGWNEQ